VRVRKDGLIQDEGNILGEGDVDLVEDELRVKLVFFTDLLSFHSQPSHSYPNPLTLT
jgi:hypothetical protein